MDEKFMALALSVTLDSESTKKRYQEQKTLKGEKLESIMTQLAEVIASLLDHKCTKFAEVILPAVDQLEMIMKYLEETFTVVEQYGVLRYEVRYIKCWNLVINYIAMLKKDQESTHALFPYTEYVYNESLFQ